MKLIRKVYDWVLKWSESKYGAVALFVMSFAEASFFPIPPDVLLIALALGARSRALKFGILCSVGSVLGAMFGFGIGYFLWWENVGEFSSLAQSFFNIIPGFTRDIFYSIQNKFDIWNFWIIFTAGFTPIPFKIFTISAGAFNINFLLFIVASTISRTARFLLVSGLIWKFGEPIRGFIENHFNILALLFTIFLIGGFLLIKYLV
ncbi:MAG: YqaA family protein [Fidelibacterota bacterium]